MFKPFSDKFYITVDNNNLSEDKGFYKDLPSELVELLNSFGGSTINYGLYRIHTFKSSLQWSLLISEYFTNYEHQIYPFGFDWMGRQFCLNKTASTIYMFDPATGEDFKLEQSLSLFHNDDLVNDTDSMLSVILCNKVLSFFKEKSINYNECFGYKIPLFLGGRDEIENYEKQDMEVYWHVESQLFNQVKNLPEGTNINKIKFK
jgi:hypothetical protein